MIGICKVGGGEGANVLLGSVPSWREEKIYFRIYIAEFL